MVMRSERTETEHFMNLTRAGSDRVAATQRQFYINKLLSCISEV